MTDLFLQWLNVMIQNHPIVLGFLGLVVFVVAVILFIILFFVLFGVEINFRRKE